MQQHVLARLPCDTSQRLAHNPAQPLRHQYKPFRALLEPVEDYLSLLPNTTLRQTFDFSQHHYRKSILNLKNILHMDYPVLQIFHTKNRRQLHLLHIQCLGNTHILNLRKFLHHSNAYWLKAIQMPLKQKNQTYCYQFLLLAHLLI